jgi:hypothetical protein
MTRVLDSANHPDMIGPGPTGPLAYSTEPLKSRVRVQRDAAGFVTITILPLAFRSLMFLTFFIGGIAGLVLVALILHVNYAAPAAALLHSPALASQMALEWAGFTAVHAAAAILVDLSFVEKTTVVRVSGDVISVRCRRWYWRSRREWPVLSVRGTRVTPMNRLALVAADGNVLCKLSVPDTADLPWLSRVVLDAVAYGQGMPDPAASGSTVAELK